MVSNLVSETREDNLSRRLCTGAMDYSIPMIPETFSELP